MADEDVIRKLRNNLSSLTRAGRESSEQDVVSGLILPLLEDFGHTVDTMRHQPTVSGKRPDIVLYNDTTAATRGDAPHVFLEAKELDANFDSASSLSETPQRQIEMYMLGRQSRPNVFGVLTNGHRWRVLRRVGKSHDIERIGEWDIFADSTGIDNIREAIKPGRDGAEDADFDGGETPWDAVLEELKGDPGDGVDLLNTISGRKASAHKLLTIEESDVEAILAKRDGDWKRVTWIEGPTVARQQRSMLGDRMVIGYAEMESLARKDVHILMRTLASQQPSGASLGIMSRRRLDGGMDACIAVHRGRRTSIGELFDTAWPNDKVVETVRKSVVLLRKESVKVEQIDEVVSNKELHQQFFRDVRAWVANKIVGRTDDDERTAVLRHLLRCMFVWAMKRRIGIPEEVFELGWVNNLGVSSYHEDVVRFLFHKRLNMSGKRPRHGNAVVQKAMSQVVFLNGSLFTNQPGDGSLTLDHGDYFGTGENAGLWTIFRRHGWTSKEESADIREQSVDPKMLGMLFENLIAAVEAGGTEFLLERMPAGTYYTPVDVVREMVKDTLTERLAANLPAGWRRRHIERLFDGSSHGLPDDEKAKNELAKSLAALRVFDPAVGSGEFLLGVTRAIKGAYDTLGLDTPLKQVRSIVENQIFGQDINALAASVARLRLFIAIEDDEDGRGERKPLPNLEAKIVCADTTGTVIRAKSTRPLSENDPHVLECVRQCQDSQIAFMDAHDLALKARLRKRRREAGLRLSKALATTGDSHSSLDAFAKHDYLNTDNDHAVVTDARWTFWGAAPQGFDIVIGNPPYIRKTAADQSAHNVALRNRARRNGYGKFDDLFVLFCKAALELTRPDGGVASLIVPLSLSFGKSKQDVRSLWEEGCQLIRLRHQDNRPDKTFGDSPVAHAENRQRTTIVLGVRGDRRCRIYTSRLGRWLKAERHRYLQDRSYVQWKLSASSKHLLPSDFQAQWPRLASKRAAAIIEALLAHGGPMQWSGDAEIGLPRTAMYFVTAAPAGLFYRRENCLKLQKREMDSLLAVMNSGVAYLWWKAWGDGFDVKAHTFAAMPDVRGIVDAPKLSRLGAKIKRRLMRDEPDVRQSGTAGGRESENMNLWEKMPEVLHDVDALILKGLGLDEEEYHEALAAERLPTVVK